MYPDKLLEHFRHPRNVGDLEQPTVTVEVMNPVCGDVLRLSVGVRAGRLEQVAYKVRGCTAAIAAGSALTEMLAHQSTAILESFKTEDLDHLLGGVPVASRHVLTLCKDAVSKLHAALSVSPSGEMPP